MKKGQHITIALESVQPGTGVVSRREVAAKVLYFFSDNITAQDADGFIQEVDGGNRDEDGIYIIRARPATEADNLWKP